jgi:hypothetical protein
MIVVVTLYDLALVFDWNSEVHNVLVYSEYEPAVDLENNTNINAIYNIWSTNTQKGEVWPINLSDQNLYICWNISIFPNLFVISLNFWFNWLMYQLYMVSEPKGIEFMDVLT